MRFSQHAEPKVADHTTDELWKKTHLATREKNATQACGMEPTPTPFFEQAKVEYAKLQ